MRRAIAIVVLLAACGGGSRRPDDKVAAAFQGCADAFGEIEARTSTELADVSEIYARGCHDIYREPCGNAVASLAKIAPEKRVVYVAQVCAAAYCGKLPEPQPRLCSGRMPDNPDELADAWRELDGSILAFEVGSDRPEIAKIAGILARGVEVKAARSPKPPAAGDDMARIAVSVTGDRITVETAGRSWHIGLAPTPAELAPIAAAVDKTHGAVVDISRDTPHGTVVAILDALRAAGVTHLAIATH